MKTITAKTTAWLAQHSGPDDLNDTPDQVINALFYSQHDMVSHGWTRVGDATITVTIPDEAAIVESKIAALRGELQTVRANAEIQCSDLENKIQKLLAITCEAA